VLVPELAAAARLRAEPELAGRPFAIVSEAGTRAAVLSVSPEATRAGVHPGASLAHARAVCGELAVRVAQPVLEHAARSTLLDVALSASPRAEALDEPGGAAAAVLDAGGLGRVFASEAALAGALVERARAQGLPAVAAVAGSRALARVAARDAVREGAGATRVVEAGREAAFLAPLSVDLLAPDDATAELLTRMGLYRLGALLALAPAQLATRLGAGVAEALAALCGARGEPPIPAPRALRVEEGIALDAPLGDLEPFLFVLGGLLSRAFARLALRHLVCGELALALELDAARNEAAGAGRHALRLRLAAPGADTRLWLRRVRLALERDPPRAPVAAIALACEGLPARRDQLDLFRPAGPAPAALDALLAELELLCGEGRVGSPRIPDDHHPDSTSLQPFGKAPRGGTAMQAERRSRGARSEAEPSGAHQARSPSGNQLLGGSGSMPDPPASPPSPVHRAMRCEALALRALRPPLPAQVRLRAGEPAAVRSAIANGDVVRCAGPWRATGGWWSETGRFAFDCFDVATSDGLLIRLRHDRLRDLWHVDAVYD
jgi:protein ImuB